MAVSTELAAATERALRFAEREREAYAEGDLASGLFWGERCADAELVAFELERGLAGL